MILESIKIAVLASGNGTNAQNIFRVAKGKGINIQSLVCDCPGARVIGRAKTFQVPVHLIPFDGSRISHEKEIMNIVEGVDWIFLAGYMRILSSEFVGAFFDKELGHSRIVNVHPSLLPKYPGLNSYKRAFDAGDFDYGVTLHFVDDGVDSGKIIDQIKLVRQEGDDLDEFIERGMKAEYQLYENFMLELVQGELR